MRWELDQVMNFKLDDSMLPTLLKIVSAEWIGKRVKIIVELKGELNEINEGYISITLSEPAEGKKEKYKTKIDISKIKIIECYYKPKLPKNFII